MICYSRSIIDYWRNRRTEEREQLDRLRWDVGEMEEKMVWEDSDCCRTPPGLLCSLTRPRYACIYSMYSGLLLPYLSPTHPH